MKLKRKQVGNALAILALWTAAASVAHADPITFMLGTGGASQDLSLSAAPGSQVTVPIYLLFSTDEITAVNNDGGLFSANVYINQTSTSGSPASGIAAETDATGNSAFDDPFGPLVAAFSSSDFDLFQDTFDPVLIDSSGSLFLGDFTFTVSSAPGNVTTFNIQSAYPGGFASTETEASNVLDSQIENASLTITSQGVAAVPLPNSALAGAAILLATVMAAALRRLGYLGR